MNGEDPLGLIAFPFIDGPSEEEEPGTGTGTGELPDNPGTDETKGESKGEGNDETKIKFSNKINKQLKSRGWTVRDVKDAVKDPEDTHEVTDRTTDPPSPATAYESKGGGYVVVNDATGRVVQISDRFDSGWQPVWNSPYWQRW